MLARILKLIGRCLVGGDIANAQIRIVACRRAVKRHLAGMVAGDLRGQPQLRLEIENNAVFGPFEIDIADEGNTELIGLPFDAALSIGRPP